jgi:hypothetical protein
MMIQNPGNFGNFGNVGGAFGNAGVSPAQSMPIQQSMFSTSQTAFQSQSPQTQMMPQMMGGQFMAGGGMSQMVMTMLQSMLSMLIQVMVSSFGGGNMMQPAMPSTQQDEPQSQTPYGGESPDGGESSLFGMGGAPFTSNNTPASGYGYNAPGYGSYQQPPALGDYTGFGQQTSDQCSDPPSTCPPQPNSGNGGYGQDPFGGFGSQVPGAYGQQQPSMPCTPQSPGAYTTPGYGSDPYQNQTPYPQNPYGNPYGDPYGNPPTGYNAPGCELPTYQDGSPNYPETTPQTPVQPTKKRDPQKPAQARKTVPSDYSALSRIRTNFGTFDAALDGKKDNLISNEELNAVAENKDKKFNTLDSSAAKRVMNNQELFRTLDGNGDQKFSKKAIDANLQTSQGAMSSSDALSQIKNNYALFDKGADGVTADQLVSRDDLQGVADNQKHQYGARDVKAANKLLSDDNLFYMLDGNGDQKFNKQALDDHRYDAQGAMTTAQAAAQIGDNFKLFDTAANGKEDYRVSRNDLNAVAQNKDKKFTQPNVDAAQRLLADNDYFRILDGNGDNRFSEKDLSDHVFDANGSITEADALQQVKTNFGTFDKAKTGVADQEVSLDDLQLMASNVGNKFNKKDSSAAKRILADQQLFDKLDGNGDHMFDRQGIDNNRYNAGGSMTESQAFQNLQAHFGMFDRANKTGKADNLVSKDELGAVSRNEGQRYTQVDVDTANKILGNSALFKTLDGNNDNLIDAQSLIDHQYEAGGSMTEAEALNRVASNFSFYDTVISGGKGDKLVSRSDMETIAANQKNAYDMKDVNAAQRLLGSPNFMTNLMGKDNRFNQADINRTQYSAQGALTSKDALKQVKSNFNFFDTVTSGGFGDDLISRGDLEKVAQNKSGRYAQPDIDSARRLLADSPFLTDLYGQDGLFNQNDIARKLA